ncbi:hypothetical protein AYJ54_12875 [Bradyrhizobium centrolobii]|uniref:Uncharacterized protein n=1 Tax=Bradyrhizobium centrolobii TaxID=1505087 RepID=A0A176YTS4_9BRAD|nr:hypothetical protein AYJ54_12875 [Bradyrhizobium centrolobii]
MCALARVFSDAAGRRRKSASSSPDGIRIARSRGRASGLVAKEGRQLLPHLAAQVPGLRRVPGTDQRAKLDGARIRIDHLEIDHCAIPKLGFFHCLLQPATYTRYIGAVIDVQRDPPGATVAELR